MSLQELKLKKSPKIYISQEIKSQIDFLHNKIGSTEWSGILFYNVVKGSITDPSNLEIEVTSLYLMDIGSSVYTEYSAGSKLIDAFETISGSESQQYGHIHTHHNMQTYFSATDKEELVDNAKNFNYYLSLIVNFSGQYSGKIAISTTIDNTVIVVDEQHQTKSFKTSKKSVLAIDCDIVYHTKEIPFDTENVYLKLKKEKEIADKKKKIVHHGGIQRAIPGMQGKMHSNFKNFGSENEIYKKHIGEINESDEPDDTALGILNEIGIGYSDIEELSASIITQNLDNKDTLADVLDTFYKKRYKSVKTIYADTVDEIYETALANVILFKEFNNAAIPTDVIFEAMLDCLEDQKDQSKGPKSLYNKMIDELISAFAYIEEE